MEVNPIDQTCRNPDKPTRQARFRHGPAASQALEQTRVHGIANCNNCLEMPCRCTSVVSSTALASSSLTHRSRLFGVCLNCPLDNQRPCSSCSAMPSASLNRSSVMTTGVPSIRATETLYEDEGSVYNGKRGAFAELYKPSTTTAMTMPGAEEATVYNGKIGPFLFSGNQSGPMPTSEEKPSSTAPLAIHTTGAATVEGRTIIPRTLMSDYKMSHDNPGQSKRSWQREMTEDRTNPSPENDGQFASTSVVFRSSEQEHSGMAVQLPVQARPSSATCNKRRKTERRRERVPAVNSEKSIVPPDPHGYVWWKDGQKIIKGSPYPRSYYKCRTRTNCDAKRQVMKAVDDPLMLDITYIGQHSHASPAAAADVVPATVPAESLEESSTTRRTDFFEYL